MLKKMSIKKIMVASSALLLLLILYLIPDNKKEIDLKTDDIEYTYNNIVSTIYLVDTDGYVARTSIPVCNCEKEELANDLVEGLIIDGKKSNIIPNGFRSIIPPGVSILGITLEDNILTIDFSKELKEIKEDNEDKMIEALIYTLTSIDGIDKVIIKVEGEVLTKLPSGKSLPTILDKSYGINKSYDLSSTNNIESYTMYYVNKYHDNKYYVPVTKYVNSTSDDKVKVIIKELSSSPVYQTNLMSYLNAGAVVEDYDYTEGVLKLNFNELLLSDITEKNILEEVVYTIGLSMDNIYNDLEKVSFYVGNDEIYTLDIDDMK